MSEIKPQSSIKTYCQTCGAGFISNVGVDRHLQFKPDHIVPRIKEDSI